MTGTKQYLRTPGIVLGILAVIIAAVGTSFAVGYAASAKSNTIKACAAKNSGTLYQAKKCKKGDKKLTWSVKGPAGAAGAPGANGAVAGFSVVQVGTKDMTDDDAYTTVVSKSMPAGSYVFTGKAQADALYTDNTVVADNSCRLFDGTASDESQIVGPIISVPFAHVNDSGHSMTLATTKTAAFTISLQCKNGLGSPPSGYTLSISRASLTGVQTSSNS